MSEVTRRATELASCILAHETAAGAGGQQDQALRIVVRTLRERLEPVISTAGFDALMGRAVRLAAREHAAAHTRPRAPRASGSGTGPAASNPVNGAAATQSADRLTVADSAILGHFLHLLAVFLGDHLTVRLLAQQWPCVSRAIDSFSRQVHP
jgi:hypothetical protein